MAEGVQQKCSHCKKMGMIRCDGCTKRFCSTHFNEHRHQLDALFERVCNDRDALCEQISSLNQQTTTNHPHVADLFKQIYNWEQETLQMVRQTASYAKQCITELMQSNNTAVETELDQFSNELRRRKDEDDYFEEDLERLSKRLAQFQMDLTAQLSDIRLNITSIEWPQIIQVVDTKECTSPNQQEALFSDGTLLTREDQVQLNQFYGKIDQKWRLIYKATRDGFTTEDFHRFCDKKGPTFTVIQSSDGYLFGGYTAAEWNAQNSEWAVDKTAFLFTLTNPHDIVPTKYVINPEGKNAIKANNVGPVFGQWDIFIHPNSNNNATSNSLFPGNYIDSTGKGQNTFTGLKHFSTTDIEIYQCVKV